eukprot:14047589-Alexandrium_andersonii.AAC.1
MPLLPAPLLWPARPTSKGGPSPNRSTKAPSEPPHKMGAGLCAKMLERNDLGHREAAPQVALLEQSSP